MRFLMIDAIVSCLINLYQLSLALYFQEGFTPLHVAASQGCKGILNSMIQHGADLNKQCKVQI